MRAAKPNESISSSAICIISNSFGSDAQLQLATAVSRQVLNSHNPKGDISEYFSYNPAASAYIVCIDSNEPSSNLYVSYLLPCIRNKPVLVLELNSNSTQYKKFCESNQSSHLDIQLDNDRLSEHDLQKIRNELQNLAPDANAQPAPALRNDLPAHDEKVSSEESTAIIIPQFKPDINIINIKPDEKSSLLTALLGHVDYSSKAASKAYKISEVEFNPNADFYIICCDDLTDFEALKQKVASVKLNSHLHAPIVILTLDAPSEAMVAYCKNTENLNGARITSDTSNGFPQISSISFERIVTCMAAQVKQRVTPAPDADSPILLEIDSLKETLQQEINSNSIFSGNKVVKQEKFKFLEAVIAYGLHNPQLGYTPTGLMFKIEQLLEQYPNACEGSFPSRCAKILIQILVANDVANAQECIKELISIRKNLAHSLAAS